MKECDGCLRSGNKKGSRVTPGCHIEGAAVGANLLQERLWRLRAASACKLLSALSTARACPGIKNSHRPDRFDCTSGGSDSGSSDQEWRQVGHCWSRTRCSCYLRRWSTSGKALTFTSIYDLVICPLVSCLFFPQKLLLTWFSRLFRVNLNWIIVSYVRYPATITTKPFLTVPLWIRRTPVSRLQWDSHLMLKLELGLQYSL